MAYKNVSARQVCCQSSGCRELFVAPEWIECSVGKVYNRARSQLAVTRNPYFMHILNAVYGDSTGGRWGATLKTAELLADRGHRVTLLLAPEDAHKVPDYGRANIEVVTLRNSGHYDLIASFRARRLIRARTVDAVIAHSGRAIHMLKRAAPRGVPVIAFNHSHNIKRTLKADAFFCITPYMKRIVDAATGGRKPAFVISNAVQVPPLEVVEERSDDALFSVGAIGRMVPNKGFQHLVAALGLLAKEGVRFRGAIAGDGELCATLMAQAEALGIRERIDFPGWIGPDARVSFFNGLDVVYGLHPALQLPVTRNQPTA